ncbi:MAG TPA: transcription termination factor NusA [Anaeromyxobacteraceae bacterium]|nr:transcription termination factor NusA [Anaeromyxobacteraceae bacterium]
MQQNVNLNLILDQVAKDKGIERATLIAILEESIANAGKRHFGLERNIKAKYDEDKGQIDLFQALTIVDEPTEEIPLPDPVNMIPVSVARAKGIDVEPGDELDFPVYYRLEDEAEARAQDEQWGDLLRLKTYRRSFGRIAAQTAKQVMIQGTRNAERENVFNEYKDRKGELITGIVRRFERGNVIVDLGRAEAVLPVREQVPRESYRAGDRIQAYVLDVLRESKGPQIILSRASVELLKKLFEQEVPEIAEGVVVIEAAAREPGGRAKIAVSSRDSDVDPVGACVGMKGSRVQAVVQELRGEKIDIVPWHEDPARFVCNALAPAEVSRVLLDDQNNAMEIIVPDDQLSLAIGRRGQNVRLASQLTGWKLDINSESRVKEMREFARESFTAIGIPEGTQEMLYAHGFRKSQDVANAAQEMLTQFPGFTMDMIPDLQKRAREQSIVDAETEMRLEQEREAARIAEARRHPDELTQEERMARVRGVGEKTIEQLKVAGYPTVEAIHGEGDVMKLAESSGLGIKKARQIKHAVGVYLEEEAKLRTELNAERDRAKAEGAGV